MLPEEKILDRIRKLLALATSNNVHEAAAAAAQAQRLMTEHQIEQATLDAQNSAFDPNQGIEESELHAETGSRCTHWKGTIGGGLAKANGCRAYWMRVIPCAFARKPQTVLWLVGHPTNAATVRYMHTYLVGEVERLVKQHKGNGRIWLHSFKCGAADTLHERVQETARNAELQAVKQADNSTSLVHVEEALTVREAMRAAVAAYVDRHIDARKARSAQAEPDWEGYQEGVDAARNIELDHTAVPALASGGA